MAPIGSISQLLAPSLWFTGKDFHPYHDYNPDDMPESTEVTPPLTDRSQPPARITQFAWLLHSILSQDPEGNDSILRSCSDYGVLASSGSAPLTPDSLNHGGLAFLSRAIWQTWRTCLLNEVLRLLNFATVTALRTQLSSWVARLLIMCKWLAFWSVRSVSSLGIFRKSPAAAGRVCEPPEEM